MLSRHYVDVSHSDVSFSLIHMFVTLLIQICYKLIPYLADQPPKHINIGQYIYSNVPSLKEFCEPATKLEEGTSALKAISTVMLLLQRFVCSNHLLQFIQFCLGEWSGGWVGGMAKLSTQGCQLGSKDLGILKFSSIKI